MFWRWFIIAPLLVALTGCAAGRKLQRLESKMEVIENRMSLLEQRQVSSESQTGNSRESVGYLKGKVDGITKMPAVVVTNQDGSRTVKTSLTDKEIQKALKDAGYYDGPIDGKIGPRTKRAIIEFQEENGLKPDGIVGERTKELLINYL